MNFAAFSGHLSGMRKASKGKPEPTASDLARGARIKAAREALLPKVSQEKFAPRVNVSAKTISRWETGEEPPSRANLEALAQAVGRSVAWLDLGIEESRLDASTSQLAPLGTADNMKLAADLAGLTGKPRDDFLAERRQGGSDYSIEVLISIAKERAAAASGRSRDNAQALDVPDEADAPRFR